MTSYKEEKERFEKAKGKKLSWHDKVIVFLTKDDITYSTFMFILCAMIGLIIALVLP